MASKSRTQPNSANPPPARSPAAIAGASTDKSWRFPIVPSICLALAGQTFRACVRRRVLLVLVLFAAMVLVSYWVAPASFPDKRVELVTRASLMAASFFGVIVVVFLSATMLPDDIRARTIYTVLTKPVGRLNYLLGRALGFSAVALVLLAVMGAVSIGVIRYAAWRADKTMPQGFSLEARRHARPEKVSYRLTPTGENQDTLPITKTTHELVLAGDRSHTMVFYFTGKELARRSGNDVTISFDVDVETGERMPKCEVAVVAVNPATGKTSEVQTELDSRRRSTVTFGPEMADPEKGMEVRLSRLVRWGGILMGSDSVTVVLSPLLYEVAFAKTLMMTFFGLVALIVIGQTASVFVSRWLAVVFTFSAYLIGVFSEVVHDLMAKLQMAGPQGLLGTSLGVQGEQGHTATAAGWAVVLNKIYLGLFKVVTIIVPDFRVFSGTSTVAGGYDVPVHLWLTALEYAVVYVAVYMAVAQLLWHRREVGL